MNVVISDTAEYGCYLFDHAAKPLLADFVKALSPQYLGSALEANEAIRSHPVEVIGHKLRGYMKDMKIIVEAS